MFGEPLGPFSYILKLLPSYNDVGCICNSVEFGSISNVFLALFFFMLFLVSRRVLSRDSLSPPPVILVVFLGIINSELNYFSIWLLSVELISGLSSANFGLFCGLNLSPISPYNLIGFWLSVNCFFPDFYFVDATWLDFEFERLGLLLKYSMFPMIVTTRSFFALSAAFLIEYTHAQQTTNNKIASIATMIKNGFSIDITIEFLFSSFWLSYLDKNLKLLWLYWSSCYIGFNINI